MSQPTSAGKPLGMTAAEQAEALAGLRKQVDLLTRIVQSESELSGLDKADADRLAERINHWFLHGMPLPIEQIRPDELDRMADSVLDYLDELSQPLLILAGSYTIARNLAEIDLGLLPPQWEYVSGADRLQGRQGGRYYESNTFWSRPDAREIHNVVNTRRMSHVTHTELATLRAAADPRRR